MAQDYSLLLIGWPPQLHSTRLLHCCNPLARRLSSRYCQQREQTITCFQGREAGGKYPLCSCVRWSSRAAKYSRHTYRKDHTLCEIDLEKLEQYANSVADYIGQSKAIIEELKAQVGSLQIGIDKFHTKFFGLQKDPEMTKNFPPAELAAKDTTNVANDIPINGL